MERGSSRPVRASADSRAPDAADREAEAGLLPAWNCRPPRPRFPRWRRTRRAAWVENRRTDPCWRRLAISTLRSTPGRPSQRSSDLPRACSSVASCAISTKAALAVRILPSVSVTTKASGALCDRLEQARLGTGDRDGRQARRRSPADGSGRRTSALLPKHGRVDQQIAPAACQADPDIAGPSRGSARSASSVRTPRAGAGSKELYKVRPTMRLTGSP